VLRVMEIVADAIAAFGVQIQITGCYTYLTDAYKAQSTDSALAVNFAHQLFGKRNTLIYDILVTDLTIGFFQRSQLDSGWSHLETRSVSQMLVSSGPSCPPRSLSPWSG
jgi:hypothetical protein